MELERTYATHIFLPAKQKQYEAEAARERLLGSVRAQATPKPSPVRWLFGLLAGLLPGDTARRQEPGTPVPSARIQG